MEELRATNAARRQAMLEGRWEEFGGEPADKFRARVAGALDATVSLNERAHLDGRRDTRT